MSKGRQRRKARLRRLCERVEQIEDTLRLTATPDTFVGGGDLCREMSRLDGEIAQLQDKLGLNEPWYYSADDDDRPERMGFYV